MQRLDVGSVETAGVWPDFLVQPVFPLGIVYEGEEEGEASES